MKYLQFRHGFIHHTTYVQHTSAYTDTEVELAVTSSPIHHLSTFWSDYGHAALTGLSKYGVLVQYLSQ